MDIVNVYNWLKNDDGVEMLGTLPKKLQVLAEVTEDGYTLKDASAEMKNDKEVVMAAVAQDGWALKYASTELKNDKEVVMAAVAQEWLGH